MRDQTPTAGAAGRGRTQLPPHSAATSAPPPRAKKSLGQNFLVDGRVRAKIVDAADVSPTDTVLEIGPGRGFLTKALAERGCRLIAVELDDALIPRLAETFADCGNVEIVHADARTVDVDSLVGTETEYKVVANLPYYAATPIVRRFLEGHRKPTTLVVMVQREVGREMAASPGKMGILSVATQVYGSPRIVASVPPKAFRPSPNVTSRGRPHRRVPRTCRQVRRRRQVLHPRQGGVQRAPESRYTTASKNGMDADPDAIMPLLRNAQISPTRRAQTLSIDEWKTLYREYASTLWIRGLP